MANFSTVLTDVFFNCGKLYPCFPLHYSLRNCTCGKLLIFAIVKIVKEFEGVSFRG